MPKLVVALLILFLRLKEEYIILLDPHPRPQASNPESHPMRGQPRKSKPMGPQPI